MATAGSSSLPTPHADDSPEPSFTGEKVYVAVGRESRATLLWALHKFPKDAAFVLVHVYSPPKFLPVLGAMIPASQMEEQELIAYKKMELQRINDSLDQYLLLCAQEKVQAEKVMVESDDVAKGLVELISEHHVTVLVMGAAADKHYTKKMMVLKSKKARVLEQQADPFCKIWFVCKGTLIYHRKAGRRSHEAMHEGRQKSGAAQSSVERSTSLSEMWCVSNTWLHKPNLGPHIENTSPYPSYDNEKQDVKEFDESDNKFQHIFMELQSVRQEACEEKCRREKAERELFEAFQKARDSENLYFGELKQKNEIEEKLTTTMEEVESLRKTTDELCAKHQEEREKTLALEKRSAHSNRIIKDLMLQRDKAVREAEALRVKKGESTATAEGTMHITEISCSEINEATNNFDHSLKVGESVYKGFLRHTSIAIKKFNPESTQSRSQFNQEVEIHRVGQSLLLKDVSNAQICRSFLPMQIAERIHQCPSEFKACILIVQSWTILLRRIAAVDFLSPCTLCVYRLLYDPGWEEIFYRYIFQELHATMTLSRFGLWIFLILVSTISKCDAIVYGLHLRGC